MKFAPWFSLLLASFIAAYAPFARADEPSANDIAARIVRSNGFNWEGAKTKLRMVLIDEKGEKSERSMEVIGRRRNGLLESKVRFGSPSDVAGTAFLTLEKAGGASEQYIYLPGLKRTRRISGRDREGSFMGSDFTYNDLQRKEDAGGKHEKLPDEQIGSDATYVIESTAGDAEKLGYSKVRTWVRKTDYVPLRTRFFDAAGKPQKTLYVRKIRDVDGKPAVVEARMQSESGHATELYVDSIERRDNLPDSDFTPASLDR